MFFASDNAGPAHPAVLDKVIEANSGYQMSYGADDLMEQVRAEIRRVFEAPDAAVYLVSTGTAANALALACYTQPWQSIYATKVSHIQEDECNAPEFYAGGAKLILVGENDKMTPAELEAAIAGNPAGVVHHPQPGALAITNVTERGTLYSLSEIKALSDIAKAHGLPVHLDGARYANAMVALGCTAAEMSWKVGVDAVSFGGTKNGCMAVEAVVFFDPEKAWEFELRRKRGAHLFSKHRYLSAQMAGYLENDNFIKTAKQANDNAAFLAQGLQAAGVEFLHEPQANMLFVALAPEQHERLQAAGAVYYGMGPLPSGKIKARMVCDWSIGRDQIRQFLDLLAVERAEA